LASVAIPYDRGLALIGDADRGHVAGSRAGLGQSLKCNRDLRGRDLLGIVLDPTRSGKYLFELALGNGANISLVIEQESAGTGSALVES
jgi:hypothetical protein